jgi:hypothetical protein
MKKVFILFLLLTLAPWVNSQEKDDPLDAVIKTIQDADAKSLSAFFNATVELQLPDHENTYSVSQGEMIMKDFFKKFPLDSFSIVQKGNTDNTSRFAICDYISGNSRYQVYLYLRKDQDKFLVQKIKFEEKK